LAERLRARAESGPLVSPAENEDALDLTIARESVASLEAQLLLFRQGARPM
jgi:hypothetical protein